jgi:pyruvate/2-oxoglutarate dehydrogenase complex dihydrolipoamide acyltransferase (E2) component
MSEFRLPELERSESVCVSRWFKRTGEPINAHEKLLEVFSERFDWDLPAPAAGNLKEISAAEGARVSTGDVLALIERAALEAESLALPDARAARISPLAARIAADQRIDLLQARGTGPAGRVNKRDVLALLQSEINPSPDPISQPDGQPGYEPSDCLTAGLPGATMFVMVDMTNVVAQRDARLMHWLQREGFILDHLPYMVLAAVAALGSVPVINSMFTPDGGAQNSGIQIEVICAGGTALIPNAEAYNLVGIARRLRAVARVDGNSGQRPFIIEDHAAGGALLATGLLAPGSAALLSVGVIQKQAVAVGDALQIHPMVYFGLTYDPRVADESKAVQFATELKRLLEVVSFS